ncbi:MAG: Gfo/Idh/MocA family oxidoreductase, partial [Hyphomicrobiaceae bacterium]
MTGTKTLRLGLIGSGFMGKTHVFGFATAMRVFDLPYDIVLASVADQNAELAEQARRSFGFEHGAGDWRQLIADDTLDIIDITAPNALHKEMAVAA